jgi:formylglycine-generating enzyme required for sulfatase activity
MSGNVWEWVGDIYNSNYSGLATDGSANLSVGDAKYRILRGGSWLNSANGTRSAFRNRSGPSLRYDSNGFRVLARPK